MAGGQASIGLPNPTRVGPEDPADLAGPSAPSVLLETFIGAPVSKSL